jgi:GTP cyclohydrolase II
MSTNVARRIDREYSQVKINTKFGRFNIRVYSDMPNKETVVLWTENLDVSKPALVRVHSECLTGDVIGSLQCDCGDQLEASLMQIRKEEGVLIYLRQEGRGIGLFEKIKAYQLQSAGVDTFEANVRLGHKPDARTYEFVKISLDDLGIGSIRLLTNNPSKISEIAKFGTNVVERVPLIMDSNIHNERYYATKTTKFQHFLASNSSHYLYQCQVENAQQAKALGEYTRDKKRDPLLKVAIGLSANGETLSNEQGLKNIKAIIEECKTYGMLPILHFSFADSADEIDDILCIKNRLPEIEHLQINDLKSEESILRVVSLVEHITLYVPLCNERFGMLENDIFRKHLIHKNAFVCIDNSKGRGMSCCVHELKEKTEKLLEFGLNNIILSGGFGPDKLASYCELRRYFRINLSIDAETGLRTGNRFDLEKAKVYLFQLLRFDDPNNEGIEHTRQFMGQIDNVESDQVEIQEHKFIVSKGIFHAGVFPSSRWYADKVLPLLADSKDFCQIGAGSGVISSLAAIRYPLLKTLATDINPSAVKNIQLNTTLHAVSERVGTVVSDVFDSVNEDARFDNIFWLMPFGYLDPGASVDMGELQVFDPGYRGIRKFLQGARHFLKPGGQLLIGFSPDLGNTSLLEEIAEENDLVLSVHDETVVTERTSVRMQLLVGKYNG